MHTRTRPPRVFDENQLLIPFDNESALATNVIISTKYKPIPGETIKFFDLIHLKSMKRWFTKKPREFYIVVTSVRFFYIKVL